MNDELIISRINELESLILKLSRDLKESTPKSNDSLSKQRFFSLKEAVELKYGNSQSYTTISTNYALIPCGNTNYEIVGGVRRWKSELILEWLNVTDKDIIPYLEKYHVPLTGRIGEKYLKKYGKKEESV
ncbi:hypothetical protein SAMN04487775_104101 [Treponema bryantii]|uniref:Uncharacterized protein n=1 Tax=Treponema bryantii TaxID=163 RepID=A0A1I3K6M2_9SPIR|nr:hypothetical protein [Treponema bryantii]SFI68064.1 hypothetical protein SAMN04487775_104101 [Treponema bryantii]